MHRCDIKTGIASRISPPTFTWGSGVGQRYRAHIWREESISGKGYREPFRLCLKDSLSVVYSPHTHLRTMYTCVTFTNPSYALYNLGYFPR